MIILNNNRKLAANHLINNFTNINSIHPLNPRSAFKEIENTLFNNNNNNSNKHHLNSHKKTLKYNFLQVIYK